MSQSPEEPERLRDRPPVVEGFRILEKLGSGATSSVWKAEQISLNRIVVIKVLSDRLARDPEDVQLFKAEARLAAAIKHSGIVQVYDFGQSQDGQRYYFVMEYISGYSVGSWLRRKGRLPEPDALIVARAVADALNYAWGLAHIIHRDIKPDNIMVDGDGTIKLTDLGLAHAVKSIGVHTRSASGAVIVTGTPNYMAPEQVRGSVPLDCRTDIYGLGATLYHMATGWLPFGDSPPDRALDRQLKEPYPDPRTLNPDLSPGLAALLVRMTAKDPAARPQTWDEVLAEIKHVEPSAPHEGAPRGESADDRVCRNCGKPMQPEARYCGYCGRLASIRLRVVEGAAPAGPDREPAGAVPNGPVPQPWAERAAHVPVPAVAASYDEPDVQPRVFRRWLGRLAGHVRMMLSLVLLVFIGVYFYQKYRHDNDILLRIRPRIMYAVRQVPGRLTDFMEELGTRLWVVLGHEPQARKPEAGETTPHVKKTTRWGEVVEDGAEPPATDVAATAVTDTATSAPASTYGSYSTPSYSRTASTYGSYSAPSYSSTGSTYGSYSTPSYSRTASTYGSYSTPSYSSTGSSYASYSTPSYSRTASTYGSYSAPSYSSTGSSYASYSTPSYSSTGSSYASYSTPSYSSGSYTTAAYGASAVQSASGAGAGAPASYEQLLARCKEEQPKIGDSITIEFKSRREPVSGVLEAMTSNGLSVKVPAGIVTYPFSVMTDACRLMYLPEERARQLQRTPASAGVRP